MEIAPKLDIPVIAKVEEVKKEVEVDEAHFTYLGTKQKVLPT